MIVVIISLLLLVVALYLDKFRPSLLFSIVLLLYLFTGILSVEDVLKGLSNKQIILIFLLIMLTNGIRKLLGTGFFYSIFQSNLKPKSFLLKLMLFVSSISAFLNNTPIVAFMIPYVKEWAEKNKYAPSKFLIPLSFVTILGGMTTVIGTSTNLVLNGLITDAGLKGLIYSDFLYLGLLVVAAGVLYIYFIGYNLLPSNESKLEGLKKNFKEFLIETRVKSNSELIGVSIKDAGLRNLEDLFLVEIKRNGQKLIPVSPDEIIVAGDELFFTGKREAIFSLIKEKNGLDLPDQKALEVHGHFNFREAIIPANSKFIGHRVKDSDFRRKMNASIIAVHRHGEKLNENIGDTVFSSGDLLLLLSGKEVKDQNDIIMLDKLEESIAPKKGQLKEKLLLAVSIGVVLLGISGILDLFLATIVAILLLVIFKKLNLEEIKSSIDIDLVILLVSSLAIGTALLKTGAADFIANLILELSSNGNPMIALSLLFIATIILTSLITNAAAVSIMFPIALSLSALLNFNSVPFFIAIAFAASGDFMTPIGYQTNLMVMGPGSYKFKDFFKVGFLFTIIYTLICLTFIYFYYNFDL